MSDMQALGLIEVVIPGIRENKNFGVYATSHSSAHRVTVRISGPEMDEIHKAAQILGMNDYPFIREAALNMARSIIRRKEKHNEHAGNRDR